MPIFDYKCPECTAELIDQFVKSDDVVLCPIDDTPMERQVAAPMGYVKGTSNPCTGR